MKPSDSSVAASAATWSRGWRRFVTVLLIWHLVAIVHTPLTLGGGFANLLGPWQWVRDYATLLYLDHGYRFFAPEPGPTHTVKLVLGDGELQQTIRLPDRASTWPRLLYHRWFMLGESLSNAVDGAVAGAAPFREAQAELEREIATARAQALITEVQELTALRDDNAREYQFHQQALRILVEGLRRLAATRYQAPQARIISCRQIIASPLQVRRRSFDASKLILELDCTDVAALWAAPAEEIQAPAPGVKLP